jgi:outer membrane protein
MRLLILTGVVATGLAASLASHAATAPDDATHGLTGWELRARAVELSPSSNALDYTTVSGTTYAEISGEWALPSNWSMEVAVGTSADYDLNSGGEMLRMMPNTLTVKYSVVPSPSFRPYVGAGLHVTLLNLVHPRSDDISGSRVGWVLQAGMDVDVGANWFVNVDLRYLGKLDPSGRVGGALRTITLNPTLLGAGIGYRWR